MCDSLWDGAEAQGRLSSVELQLGQEMIQKLRQGAEIKHCNIDCICDSETLGAVCVMAGFENQWMMDLSCHFVISKADSGKQNLCKNMSVTEDCALCVLLTPAGITLGIIQV